MELPVRLRYPFAGAFAALVLISAYVGLGPNTIPAVNDKALHFIAFFLLTLTLYWALDLPRRFLLKIVLSSMLFLCVASEVVQGFLPNDRLFDPIDIAFNVGGSLSALALCNWYNKRMLERRRQKKYGIVPTGEGEDDVELAASAYNQDEQELGIVEDDPDEEDGEAWDAMDEPDATTANANGGKS